jgi:methanogenic corrinoid protein MtbC1
VQQADAGRLVDGSLDAALAGRREDAVARVIAPLDRGECTLLELYEQVLAPAAARVGDLWHSGAISIADEHLVTRTTKEAMARARRAAPPPGAGRGLTVLACPPDEQHEVGLELVGDLRSRRGSRRRWT